MKKRDYKNEMFDLLEKNIDGMTFDEQMQYAEKLLVDFQKEHEDRRDTSNKGKPWKDEELKIVLSDAATESNCLKYAKLFHRGYGSIEQIYRWSVTPKKDMSDERKEDSFVQQVKRVAKELGIRG